MNHEAGERKEQNVEESKARTGHARLASRWLFLAAVAVGGLTGFLTSSRSVPPRERSFTILARQYSYEPAVIRVNRGDTVRLRFGSLDVVHGFYLEGYDLNVTISPMRSTVEMVHPSHPDDRRTVEEVVFKADREGKYRYRCSHTCGFMHPFMLGEMIVGPNRLFPTSVGMAFGVLLGGLASAWRSGRDG